MFFSAPPFHAVAGTILQNALIPARWHRACKGEALNFLGHDPDGGGWLLLTHLLKDRLPATHSDLYDHVPLTHLDLFICP
jgi:hypothetical protein